MNVRELAKLANVSIATISRVVNRPDAVLPETREHVLSVMRENGYNLGGTANRRSSSEHTRVIALLVPDAADYLNLRLMAGIESIAARREYTVCLYDTHNNAERERALIRAAFDQRADGLVIVSNLLDEAEADRLLAARVPVVIVGRSKATAKQNTCYINFEEGAYRMARHLLELGRKKIVLLCGTETPHIQRRMLEGLDRAQRELGAINLIPPTVVNVTGSIPAGYTAVSEILSGEQPDAVFASSDELAAGLMKALREKGIHVPEQIAVTGFTDSPMAEVLIPELTTVEQPTHRLGMVGARMLFDLIDDDSLLDATPQEIVLLPKLKIRASCGNRRPINTLFE